MFPKRLPLVAALIASVLLSLPVASQEWRPATTEMPTMPRMAEMAEDWMSTRSAWIAGVQAATGVSVAELRPTGEGRGATAQVVRFNQGPRPAIVWQDRNGDGRADLIEIFRNGRVSIQVIDADYDGRANVLRRYEADGTLIREERL